MSGQNRDEEIAVRYPHLSPIADALEQALASIVEFNGGHGVVTIHMKGATIPEFDVSMRYFQRQSRLNNKIA